MQKTYRHVLLTPAKSEEETIQHFSLQGALPSSHILALNLTFGTISYISSANEQPLLLMQEQFTRGELSVLLPLLDAFPYYCPYEIMYAHFYHGTISEKTIDRCRERLQEAASMGLWDQEMRPIRSALSRTRLKLRPFGVEIASILAIGYQLMSSQTAQLASA